MAFLDLEQSTEDGRPIALYQFTLNSQVWRYTSAAEKITADGHEWLPAAISDDGTKQTGEIVNDAMTITAPTWIGPAQVFMSGAPSSLMQVALFGKHEGSADLVAVYLGEVTQINPVNAAQARFTCENLASSMRRQGLRIAWQRTCPYALYDSLTCKVDKAAWAVPFFVLAVNGFDVTIVVTDPKANGYFSGGFIEWVHPIKGREYLPIDNNVAVTPLDVIGVFFEWVLTLNLLADPGDLYVGASGTAYPGCNFTPAACQAFDNYANYGGIPDLPGKSPFDGMTSGNPFF